MKTNLEVRVERLVQMVAMMAELQHLGAVNTNDLAGRVIKLEDAVMKLIDLVLDLREAHRETKAQINEQYFFFPRGSNGYSKN